MEKLKRQLTYNYRPSPELEKQAIPSFIKIFKDELEMYKARVLSKDFTKGQSFWTHDQEYTDGRQHWCEGEIIYPILNTENYNKIDNVEALFYPRGARDKKEDPFKIYLKVPKSMFDGTEACQKFITKEYLNEIQKIINNIKIGFLQKDNRNEIYNKLKNFSVITSITDEINLTQIKHYPKSNLTLTEFIYKNDPKEYTPNGGIRKSKSYF